MDTDRPVPHPTTFTSAPLRHRLHVALDAPVPDVWSLIGRHVRLPEYSAGIASVELENPAAGPRVRVCHFRAPDGSGEGPILRERILWEEENAGYATSAEPDNAFGLANSLSLVTVAPIAAETHLRWEEYYDSADVPAARASFDDGLADIAERLVARFGGRIIERYVDRPR